MPSPLAHRSWIFPRDPQFEQKAARVLDLYQGCWQDQPLGSDEYVLSADEKTSIQARVRLHPTQPVEPDQAMRLSLNMNGACFGLFGSLGCPARQDFRLL